MSNQANAAGMEGPAPAQVGFGRPFWMCNSIEMFERLAYFGIRSVVPIYIMQATEPGGLHLTAVHKGWIYMWWAILQSWLPMFTGGIADRYGYKRVLFFAIIANVIGYLIMATFQSYQGFFAGILVLATGTAFFKPALQGTIAQNLNKANSSVGWGVFYWVVNVGAVMAPVLATIILGKPHSAEGWRTLFIASAIFTACNLFLLLTFRDVPSGADKSERLWDVFARTIENIWPFWFVGGRRHVGRWTIGVVMLVVGLVLFVLYESIAKALNFEPIAGMSRETVLASLGGLLFFFGALLATWLRGGTFRWQLRLPAFLLIMSCFWMMMYQLWDLQPNFITDWIDSSAAAGSLKSSMGIWWEYGDRGLLQVPQQILLNLNAFLIVLLVIPISWAARRMRTLSAMLIGMLMATTGVLVAGLTQSGWILLLGIVFFSLGEMWTGPKKNEYLGLIAPPGKKGLYLGYVNIPIGIGVGLGSWLAGVVYDNYGEKATLALKELAGRPAIVGLAARSMDWSDSLDKVPQILDIQRSDALAMAQAQLGVNSEGTAGTLRNQYRFDDGQITNLALRYLNDHNAGSEREPKRAEAFEVLRDRLNGADNEHGASSDGEIIAMLWNEYGENPEVLTDLATEYLAQGTDLLADAVARRIQTLKIEDPVEDLDRNFGIGRTKSFDALSAAEGADASEVEAALRDISVSTGSEDDRVFVYLANLPHIRFVAIARRDWTADVPLLQAMVESSPAAKQIVEARIDEKGFWDYTVGAVMSVFSDDGEPTLYQRLAEKQHVIQAALAEKDWSQSPEQARQLLRLSVPEARVRASVVVNGSAQRVTDLLWDRYHPQYKVWLPFAAIGVLAAIALAIFGQMAKRWADMNA
jgi:MFS family permease